MITSLGIVLFLSLFTTLLMGILSYINYKKNNSSTPYAHLTEFWASLFVMSCLSFFYTQENPRWAAMTMLGWIWPLRTFKLVLEDMTARPLMQRWEYVVLAVGIFSTIALGGYGYPFLLFTLPGALAIGLVGMVLVAQARKMRSSAFKTPLQYPILILMGLWMGVRLSFPFWRLEPFYGLLGLIADAALIIGFACTTLSFYTELLRQKHEERTEELIKERNEKLFSQSKYSELGMMSAGIAHEINNPLAVIQARTTQLLRIYRDPQKQRELADGLQQILYTSERINRTIQGVREFVHQDDRAANIEIRLKDLVDDVLSFCGQRMKNHGINLRFYGLENFSVRGHKIQLEQVVLNLLNNAFDAIEFLPDKWIEMSVVERPETYQIFVKDSGKGIPPEIATRMMEPFFSTKDIGKGTGLGLALARGIVEKHGGHLCYVPNTPHTTFMLELPRPRPEQDWGLPLVH
jgi:signal transduction histidine kinase